MSESPANQEINSIDSVAPGSDVDSFWGHDEALGQFVVTVRPAEKPLCILEKLGSSPFERGQFPFIGFLATTFEKVSQFALERAGYRPPDSKADI